MGKVNLKYLLMIITRGTHIVLADNLLHTSLRMALSSFKVFSSDSLCFFVSICATCIVDNAVFANGAGVFGLWGGRFGRIWHISTISGLKKLCLASSAGADKWYTSLR